MEFENFLVPQPCLKPLCLSETSCVWVCKNVSVRVLVCVVNTIITVQGWCSVGDEWFTQMGQVHVEELSFNQSEEGEKFLERNLSSDINTNLYDKEISTYKTFPLLQLFL